MTRRNWTREELIIAFNLYCKTPFGQIHIRNPEIIDLANLIKRTPSAVSWKLANFARLDPSLQRRGIVGATHGSKSEKVIWDEFNQEYVLTYKDRLIVTSCALLYALMIASIDREIVSAKNKWAALLRIPLAIAIGIVISVPLKLKILEGNINQHSQKRKKYRTLSSLS